MKIEVLGPGCSRCDQLLKNATTAVGYFDASKGLEVVKISDAQHFTQKGVFMTPGLIIDGEVVSVGKVLSADEIKDKIREKLS